MFKTFTWGQYAGLVFVLLAAYYLFVAAAYYRAEVLALLKGTGKGGAALTPVVTMAPRPSFVGGSGSLIPKAVLVAQEESTSERASTDEAEAARTRESQDELEGPEFEEAKIDDDDTDSINNPNRNEDEEALPGPQEVDPEQDFAVDVAQLSDYFDGAAAGGITQEELVAHLPELENTDLLVAFFQRNTKAAQQLTSQYYVDVPEPVLD